MPDSFFTVARDRPLPPRELVAGMTQPPCWIQLKLSAAHTRAWHRGSRWRPLSAGAPEVFVAFWAPAFSQRLAWNMAVDARPWDRGRLRPFVAALLSISHPPAVPWLVVAVVVDPVDLVRRRGLRPHVRVEGGERLLPTFADLNATPAIVAVAVDAGIVAPPEHATPRLILVFCVPIATWHAHTLRAGRLLLVAGASSR